MPERRTGIGRRTGDPKEPPTKEDKAPEPPPPPQPPTPEVEPNRRHFLHRKIGGKKAA